MACRAMPNNAQLSRQQAAIHGITGANRGHALFREQERRERSGTMDGGAVGLGALYDSESRGQVAAHLEYTLHVALRQEQSGPSMRQAAQDQHREVPQEVPGGTHPAQILKVSSVSGANSSSGLSRRFDRPCSW